MAALTADPECGVGALRALAAGPQAVATARLVAALAPPAGGWLWRTAKADVPPAELGIPPQAHVTVRLALSPIEAHWYALQHREVAGTVRRALPAAAWASPPGPLWPRAC